MYECVFTTDIRIVEVHIFDNCAVIGFVCVATDNDGFVNNSD